jgi:hypothetical protein
MRRSSRSLSRDVGFSGQRQSPDVTRSCMKMLVPGICNPTEKNDEANVANVQAERDHCRPHLLMLADAAVEA